ncbi:MAG: hypothetical protein ACJ763_05275 [Bdellovibrionia bacterium]
MKAQKILMALVATLLSGCATTANYQAKVQSWENHDALALVKAWGQPDSVEKMSNGNKMYVYARLKHMPVAYGSQRAIASVDAKQTPAGGEVYIQCATYFQLSPAGKVVSTEFRGDECKSRD